MMIAATVNTTGAQALTMSAKGASKDAKPTLTGKAINAAMIPPEIIFRSAICGTPSLRSTAASSSMGTAIVSPGTPMRAVGIA